MIRYLLSRIGCLLLILGSIVLVVGIAAENSGESAFDIVLIGAVVTFTGFLLWNRLRPKTRSSRFSIFRGSRRGGEDQEEDGRTNEGWRN